MKTQRAIPLAHIARQISKAQRPNGMKTSVVCIDGCGGAGKSTLAKQLSQHLADCPIIHTDDFASWDNPLNWYERMVRQVLQPLRDNQPANYQRYDWNRKEMTDWLSVEPSEYVLIEGVSSTRKEFRPFISFHLEFLSRPKEKSASNEVLKGMDKSLANSG